MRGGGTEQAVKRRRRGASGRTESFAGQLQTGFKNGGGVRRFGNRRYESIVTITGVVSDTSGLSELLMNGEVARSLEKVEVTCHCTEKKSNERIVQRSKLPCK